MTLMAIMILVLTPCTSDAIKASNCEASTVAASQMRTAPMMQDKLEYSTNDAKCRVVIAQFVEAVTARQAAATCQDSASRQRALKIIDAEIEAFHDRIAEQSCVQ